MRFLRFLGAWLAAIALLFLRATCRVHWHGDVRPALREAGRPYIYAILHCHQVGAVVAREAGTGAMLSRSSDGDLLAPSLRLNGITPYRGSSRRRGKDKGGNAALAGLLQHLASGRPAYLAVDGPRGPRNEVQPGAARLAIQADATVLTALARPSRRWILTGTWDRFQIPKPFSRIDAYFGEPLDWDHEEDVGDFRQRIEDALLALEEQHDPEEAAFGKLAAEKRLARFAVEAREDAADRGVRGRLVVPDGARPGAPSFR